MFYIIALLCPLLCSPMLTAAADVNGSVATINNSRLAVDVHYETLCPDSVRLIRRVLKDALNDYNLWPNIDLRLVPFGKADFYGNAGDKMLINCQHGQAECDLNALHACILEQFDIKTAFELIACMMDSYGNRIDICAKQLNLDVTKAKQCHSSRSIVDILLPYGRETLPLNISFVPTIVVDKKFDEYNQRYIRNNFLNYFCQQYRQKFNATPSSCDKTGV